MYFTSLIVFPMYAALYSTFCSIIGDSYKILFSLRFYIKIHQSKPVVSNLVSLCPLLWFCFFLKQCVAAYQMSF